MNRHQLDLYELALANQYTIARARSGQETLAVALAERPDVIVLDVLMPGQEDGFTTCAKLHEHPGTATIPVLLLTAHDGVDLEARAVSAGATMLLHKPCPAERLALTINAAISVRNLASGG